MKSFKAYNFKISAGHQPADIVFICNRCIRKVSYKEAQSGCSICENKLFRTARIVLNPYRSQNSYWTDNTDPQKINDPGSADQIGGSGLGPDATVGQDTLRVKDGADGEQFGTPGGSSENLLPDDSPLREVNQPHTTTRSITSLFDRIREERKPR